MNVSRIALALFSTLAIVPLVTQAAGVHRHTTSSSYLGTAGAGMASDKTASAAYNNPAGLAYVKQATFEGALVGAQTTANFYDNGSDSILPTFEDKQTNLSFDDGFSVGPALYYAHPISDNATLGFAMTSPLGGSSDFGENWVGDSFVKKVELSMVQASASLGYQLNPQWAVGLSLGVAQLSWELDVNSVAPAPEGAPVDYVELPTNIEVDDTEMYWTAGLMYTPFDELTIGLTYYRSIGFMMTGDFTMQTPDGPLTGSASHGFTAPNLYALGVNYSVQPNLRLLASLEWSQWSAFEKTQIDLSSIMGEERLFIERNWRNTWSYAVGGEYDITPEMTLRAGIRYDNSPMDTDLRKIDPPADRQIGYAAGFSYKVNKDTDISLNYMYLDAGDVEVDYFIGSGNLRGDSELHVHLFNLGVNIRF